MKKAGIYKITNINNGKCYIGKSTNLKARRKQHYYNSTKLCNYLYNDIACWGIDNFTFEYLYETEYFYGVDDVLRQLEGKYIIEFNSVENGYNRRYEDVKKKNNKIKDVVFNYDYDLF